MKTVFWYFLMPRALQLYSKSWFCYPLSGRAESTQNRGFAVGEFRGFIGTNVETDGINRDEFIQVAKALGKSFSASSLGARLGEPRHRRHRILREVSAH